MTDDLLIEKLAFAQGPFHILAKSLVKRDPIQYFIVGRGFSNVGVGPWEDYWQADAMLKRIKNVFQRHGDVDQKIKAGEFSSVDLRRHP